MTTPKPAATFETYADWSWKYLSERGLQHLWTGDPDVPFRTQAQRARNEAAKVRIQAGIDAGKAVAA